MILSTKENTNSLERIPVQHIVKQKQGTLLSEMF